ncbi:hypothetical protein SO802_027224 [Lithocarpus litseifolius]|uniref:Uncharacterized protein n=1 Tax=Lithocarpus litseifolius TaxID=425828 RepID=A0AAW2C5K3_9ROSI
MIDHAGMLSTNLRASLIQILSKFTVLYMVDDEPKRPSVKILLDHDFFKNCTPSSDYLKLNLFQGLLSIEERFKNKEPVEGIFNAQRLEFDLGPPLLLSKGSSNGGGEGKSGRDDGGDGTSGKDGCGDNEIKKKILILRDFHVQLKERISFLQEGKMDLNNLKHMLKTEGKNYKDEMEKAHKVAMKLADMVVECTEAHTHNLKQFIPPPKKEQNTKPNP